MKRLSERRRKRLCHWLIPNLNDFIIFSKRLIDPTLPPRHKIIRVKTADIQYFIYNDFLNRNCTFQGDVKGGDWDLRIRTRKDILSNTDKYKGIHEHFSEGIPWQDTSLFIHEYRKRIESGRIVKGATTIKELAEVYKCKYDTLFNNMHKDGFLSPDDHPKIDPVYIYIGRNGEIIYTSNGNHRLAMALELGIEEIPVRVWWRHKQWQRTRRIFSKLTKGERLKRFYSLLDHPDLGDL